MEGRVERGWMSARPCRDTAHQDKVPNPVPPSPPTMRPHTTATSGAFKQTCVRDALERGFRRGRVRDASEQRRGEGVGVTLLLANCSSTILGAKGTQFFF